MKEAAAKEARRAKAARRSEREDAARAAAARVDETEEDPPTSPTGSERSLSSFKSPSRHGGKLLSSRDSARLRLMSKRLMLRAEAAAASAAGRRGDGKTSPMKTRAARRASADAAASASAAKSTKPRRTDSVETPTPPRLEDASTPRRKASSTSSAPPEDGKAVKQWLNRSARASNVVGRGGGGGWDDADDVKSRDKGKTNARASSKIPDKAGRGGFKRRRAYDDLDEEYDRGKLSKHARRKAEGTRGGSKKSAPRSAGGAARNPFQSAAKLKRER